MLVLQQCWGTYKFWLKKKKKKKKKKKAIPHQKTKYKVYDSMVDENGNSRKSSNLRAMRIYKSMGGVYYFLFFFFDILYSWARWAMGIMLDECLIRTICIKTNHAHFPPPSRDNFRAFHDLNLHIFLISP